MESFAKPSPSVIPTKVGIHNELKILDSRLHGDDHLGCLWQNAKVSIEEEGFLLITDTFLNGK